MLAGEGQTGLMYTAGKGIAPESDIAVISILGYDAMKYYTGRGPLEALAAGIKINQGDLAFCANFATRGRGRSIKDRRVGRNLSTEEASQLCKELNKKVKLDSVPLPICGGGIKPDTTSIFLEKACLTGKIGKIRGTQLMPLLVKYANAKK